jgi:hypothetical protein
MRLLRFVLLSLSLTLMLLALGAVSVHGVSAATPVPVMPALDLRIVPPSPCPGEPVSLVIGVPHCPPCIWVANVTRVDTVVVVRIAVRLDCATVDPLCQPDSVVVRLGTFTPGLHAAWVTYVRDYLRADTLADSSVTHQPAVFVVRDSCGVPPPPSLVDHIQVGGAIGCDSCPPIVCNRAPIALHVDGHLPNTCWSVRKVEILPSLLTVIGPPTVRILLDDGGCLERPCAMVVQPWSVDTVLPGLPPGGYRLPVQIGVVTCSDSVDPTRMRETAAPFAVMDTCGPPPPPEYCFMTQWGPQVPGTMCNTFAAPGGEGALDLGVTSTLALAGLQGVLHASPSLHILGLEPIGPARGMQLQWRPTPDGARFVLFATSGAPIPPIHRTPDGCDPPTCQFPVLRVHVGQARGVPSMPMAFVMADSLLGADSLARAILPCPVRTMNIRIEAGIVCLPASCDVNGDGRGDVLDLVEMVHCILGGGTCADSIAGHHDCDENGTADLADIICCARSMLGGPPRDSVPDRCETGLALAAGEAKRDGGRVTLPLTLQGADRVGALRMNLRFPADRYDVTDLTSSAGSGWLALHQVVGNEIVVGLIALAPQASGATVPLALELSLKSGQTHGGEVTVESADLSTPDGAAATTLLAGTTALIEPPTAVALAIHPNPVAAAGNVTFALPKAGEVDLAVFDIAGRRIATLASGPLPAGVHVRAWDARGVHDGVYFVRLRADGTDLVRKAVLRRGR